jgi:energy-coupling factor transport system permease protein
MTRITLGQYYPTNSIIHRLDPRVKLTATFMYITALLLVNHFIGYAAAAVYITLIIKLSYVPFRLMLRGLRVVMFMLIFAASINLFLTPGEPMYFSFGIIQITQQGIILALQMAVRLILLIIGSSILTLATSPIQLTDAIESLLRPLKPLKVPAHDIAMMMTIALRFIPTLNDELSKIIKAQKARGADFETGNLLKRAKSLIPIFVPLFISAFKRADELATAMEARCYRGDIGRTKMKTMKMTPVDWLAMGAMTMFCIGLFFTRFL